MTEKLRILYQDENYVGIYKPAGLLVHRTALDANETVFCVQLLRNQIGMEVFPCHRLDKATSGVMLFALNKNALKLANDRFAEGKIEKVYHAIVRGWIKEPGKLDYPLTLEDGVSEESEKVQEAVTIYRPLELFEMPVSLGRYETARFSLIELTPQTGRRHQLRRHMAHLRHPILGDTTHGDGLQNRFFRDRFACDRLLLTSVMLCLDHPVDGSLMRIESAPDRTFLSVLNELSEWNLENNS
jgi:tRNA pseudouridine65 synthase